MDRQQLLTHYATEKAKLNPEQRQAVETIEGPVMVLAGPGTGKTQVLAFRVAEILLKSDVRERNILALTFTESGVTAMRERLVSLIGVTAYGVGIYTFHSFANRVIQESGAEFYKAHSLDQIDDIAQIKLVMQLIDASDNELIRPPRAPYFYVRPILSTIKSLKSEGVTPDDLRRLCRESIDSLSSSESSFSKSGKTKGELKQSVKDNIKRLERSIVVAEMYEHYEKHLTTHGLYDYEDMILFVLKTFDTNPDLKAQYQEQFQYILVDEYQDTNNAQNRLVRVLSDYFEVPNLFVVGDDKQSIYRFQGASVANLLSFREWYPEATIISLRQNYRSGQIILDNAHALIGNNKEQLSHILPEVHTELEAQRNDGAIDFQSYPDEDQESLGVVSEVKKLLEQGVSAAQIAIIYRENSEAERFSSLLSRQGIAFHLEAGSDILGDRDIRHLLDVLELAHDPYNEQALFRYLHAPYSGITTADLLRFGRWVKGQRIHWWEALASPVLAEQFTGESSASLQSVADRVQEWYRYAKNHNLGETVEHVFIDSGLLAALMEQANHLERLHRVRAFFDDVKQLVRTERFATLRDLFERLAIRQTYKVPIMCSPLVDRTENAVRLMTAHKSKGLEFEYVFVPGFCESRWTSGRKNQSISLPSGIVPHHETNEDQAIEEERRLCYVALTRAKVAVYISYAEFDGENRKQLPSQFVAELSKVQASALSVQSGLQLGDFFSPVQTYFVDAMSQAYLKEIVSQQAITPTGLNTYLQCPMEYLYRTVYAIPGVREPDQAYGTAIHKALELWGNAAKAGQRVLQNDLIGFFTSALEKEGLTAHELARFQNLGQTILSAYFERMAESWRAPLATEYSFTPHSVMLNGSVPITGKLDKIEAIPGSKHVRVIDYKTGRVRSRNEIEGKTAAKDEDYKRQLIFYAVLAEADPFFPYTIGEATLAFIDDDMKFTEETFVIEAEEKQSLKELIMWVYSEANSLHFDHTPHTKKYGRGESLCDLLRTSLYVSSEESKLSLPLSQSVATDVS